jgi:uncharacterized protein YlbG (UPF0298 family)
MSINSLFTSLSKDDKTKLVLARLLKLEKNRNGAYIKDIAHPFVPHLDQNVTSEKNNIVYEEVRNILKSLAEIKNIKQIKTGSHNSRFKILYPGKRKIRNLLVDFSQVF